MKKLLLAASLCLLNSVFAADIVETAQKSGKFDTLIKAADAAQLVDVLKSDGPFTLFAPNDEAFSKIPKKDLANLLKSENLNKLQSILKFHLVSGKFRSDQLPLLPLGTLNEQDLKFTIKDDNVFVNNSKVLKADIEVSNGVIHVIDSVLIPTFTPELNTVESIITKGITMGVPHFNHGNHEACADIYEMTLNCIKLLPENELSSNNRKLVTKTLKELSSMKSPTDRAWGARRSLDMLISSNN